MEIFKYGQTEIEHLRRRDKKLGEAIDRIGMIERKVMPDGFAALVKSVVSQQISSKAAGAIWERLCEGLAEITAESVAGVDTFHIQGCGLSARKAGYIKGIAEAVMCGEIDLVALREIADEEVIRKLSSLHGIGIWTAEMFLIFSLCRPDVLSWDDLAIRRGMMNLYGLKKLTRERFEQYRKRYSPYGSVASLYLWALSVM
jgi:DNA-3-methyladenine glycosylase II